MIRLLTGLSLCTVLLLSAASAAQAQYRAPNTQLGTPPISPYQGPTVSPYLNMFRAGASPAVNYYGLVRPQFEFGNSIQQLQQQSAVTQQEISGAEQNAVTTGHPVGFQTYGRYFNTFGRPGTVVGSRGAETIFSPRSRVPSGGLQAGVPVPR